MTVSECAGWITAALPLALLRRAPAGAAAGGDDFALTLSLAIGGGGVLSARLLPVPALVFGALLFGEEALAAPFPEALAGALATALPLAGWAAADLIAEGFGDLARDLLLDLGEDFREDFVEDLGEALLGEALGFDFWSALGAAFGAATRLAAVLLARGWAPAF